MANQPGITMLFGVDYLPILVVMLVAWLVPVVISLLKINRIPAVVIEILIGYLLGHFLIGFVSKETLFILDFLAILGLMFIMFLSGLEIDFDQLTFSLPGKNAGASQVMKSPLIAGTLHYILTLVLSLAGSFVVARFVNIPNVWFFSLILTTTFLGLILPVLKNRGETNTLYGQMIIVAAAVADVIGIILLMFTTVYIRFGIGKEMYLIVGLFLVFILSYNIGKRIKLPLFRRITYQLAHAASQIHIRGAMLLLFIFVTISQFLGQEGILLGAFLSGLLLSAFLHKERSLLLIKLEGMGYGFFIPVFFIMVGAKFNIKTLNEFDQSLIIILVLITLLVFLVKVLPSFLWVRFFGFRKTLAGGFLMASRLGLVIAAAFVGMQLGAVTPGMNTILIIVAVITCIFSPLLYNLIYKQEKLNDDKTVIIGGSSIGVLLARRLKMHGRASVIIEHNESRYKELLSKGIEVIFGDGLNPEIYDQIKLKKENFIVVHTGNNEQNEAICKLLRQNLFHERIISKPSTMKDEIALRNLGVEVVDSRLVLASTFENMIIRPMAHHTLLETFENYIVDDLAISAPQIDGKKIKEIHLHKDAMLMMLSRGNERHIPHGDTYLKNGDILTVIGTATAIDQIKKLMSGH